MLFNLSLRSLAVFDKRSFFNGFFLLLFLTMSIFSSAPVSAAENEAPTVTKSSAFKGTLYLIGGSADKSLKRFAELAGGENALVAIIPHASSTPVETADEVANQLASYGVKKTVAILPGPAGSKGTLPKDVTAVFITGGDQNRLMRLIDKDLMDSVCEFLKNDEKAVVGGTSAGAAAAVPIMIAGGMEDGLPKADSLRVSKGLGFLPGYIVDTHVYQRARHDRIKVALTLVEKVKGIGLDEDTAVEIKNGKAMVHGAGLARLYTRAADFESKLSSSKPGELASVRNVIESIVPAGEEFDVDM